MELWPGLRPVGVRPTRRTQLPEITAHSVKPRRMARRGRTSRPQLPKSAVLKNGTGGYACSTREPTDNGREFCGVEAAQLCTLCKAPKYRTIRKFPCDRPGTCTPARVSLNDAFAREAAASSTEERARTWNFDRGWGRWGCAPPIVRRSRNSPGLRGCAPSIVPSPREFASAARARRRQRAPRWSIARARETCWLHRISTGRPAPRGKPRRIAWRSEREHGTLTGAGVGGGAPHQSYCAPGIRRV